MDLTDHITELLKTKLELVELEIKEQAAKISSNYVMTVFSVLLVFFSMIAISFVSGLIALLISNSYLIGGIFFVGSFLFLIIVCWLSLKSIKKLIDDQVYKSVLDE